MRIFIRSVIFVLLYLISASVSSQNYKPYAVVTSANGGSANDTVSAGESFSGAAPIVMTFYPGVEESDTYGYACEWRIYEDGHEDSPLRTYFDDDIEYTFSTFGTLFVKFYITFTDKTTGEKREFASSPITVTVGSSSLKVPNAFSPNGDGTNDVLFVTYESIVKFDAYIFNRWGQQIYHWNLSNIDQGWDGTYGGKTVKDGVYFILVNAEGADGIKYKIKKDINVLTGLSAAGSTKN